MLEWYAKKRKRTKSKIRFTRRDDIRENEQDFWPKEKDWLIEKLVGTEKIPKKNKKDIKRKKNFKQGSLRNAKSILL